MTCALLLVLSVQHIMTTKQEFYPHQNMELRCTRPESVHGRIRWRVKGKDLAGSTAKYNITNDGSGSTLTVNDVSERDRGESHDLSTCQYKVLLYMTERPIVDSV